MTRKDYEAKDYEAKDYEAIAAILKAAHAQYSDHAPTYYIQAKLTELFATDDPHFNAARFSMACQVQS